MHVQRKAMSMRSRARSGMRSVSSNSISINGCRRRNSGRHLASRAWLYETAAVMRICPVSSVRK